MLATLNIIVSCESGVAAPEAPAVLGSIGPTESR